MDRKTITMILNHALYRLVNEESDLIDLGVSERAVTHHLARILQELIPESYDVDVEYNRHGIDPKRLNLPPRAASDRELRATTVFPDVVVHKRNTDASNLLVLEVKKPGESIEYDLMKLKAFLHELNYTYAAHIIIGRASEQDLKYKIDWV